MPKLVIDTCGDEFFTIDDWAYWINLDGGLPGVNHYLMAPNTEHSEVNPAQTTPSPSWHPGSVIR